MSYSRNKNSQKYTKIDDLPELTDGEYHNDTYNNQRYPKYNNFSHTYHHAPETQYTEMPAEMHAEMAPINYNQSNCVDISHHCQNCPVCKKIYSSDKTLYIIPIVILAIICILLLKKVLDA